MLPLPEFSYSNMCAHKALKILRNKVDLEHQCGYITMLNHNNRRRRRPSDADGGAKSFFLIPIVHLTNLWNAW